MPARSDIPIAPVDRAEPNFIHDPIGNYAKIRDVGRLTYMPSARAILVTGYAEAAAVLRDPVWSVMSFDKYWERLGHGLGRDYGPIVRVAGYMPTAHEGPRHHLLRQALAKGLAAIDSDDPRVYASVGPKVDAFRARGGGDLATDLGRHLLFDIMCDLMQVPVADRPEIGGMAVLSRVLDASAPLKARDVIVATIARGVDFLTAHARSTIGRTNPPILQQIHDALPPREGDRAAITANLAAVLLLMGNDVTASSLTMAVRRLLDPARPGPPQPAWGSLSDDAIRYAAPVDSTIRIASADTDVLGCPMSKGTGLFVSLTAANHDPRRYGEAHASLRASNDVGLAFGGGRHLCLGRGLARAILKRAFGSLAELPPLRLAGPVAFGPGRIVRTLESVPVELV